MTARPGQRAGRQARRGGLTLAELMVAVAILAIIVVTFSIILSQSQRVVSTSQRTMRANAAAAAIGHAIRKDFRRLTHNGFLLMSGPGDDMQCWLVTAGPSRSLTGGPVGTAGIIGYGLCNNPNAEDPDYDVLWRGGYVLYRQTDEDPDFHQHINHEDVLQGDLADLQRLEARNIDGGNNDLYDLIEKVETDFSALQLHVPATTLDEVNDLWMVLREDVEELQFAWTDGETDDDGNLKWYTPDDPKEGEQPYETGGGGSYKVVWTRHNLGDWPVAVRVRFKLAKELLPQGIGQLTYEVVCPVCRAASGLEEGGP